MNVEKRKVSRTGVASLGWFLGRGYVQEKLTVKSDVWCVVDGKDVIAECRSKKRAELLLVALNNANEQTSRAAAERLDGVVMPFSGHEPAHLMETLDSINECGLPCEVFDAFLAEYSKTKDLDKARFFAACEWDC